MLVMTVLTTRASDRVVQLAADVVLVAPGEDDLAVGDDLDDVGGGGREDGGVLVAAGACGAGRGGVEGDQVGAVAHRDRARVVVPEAGVAVVVAARRSSPADQCPRSRVARRSSSSTARISSNRSMTAWLSEPRVSGLPASCRRPARADAVAEVALGGGAEAGEGTGGAEVADVVVGQVGRVHGTGQRPEHAVVGEQLRGGGAVRRDAGVVLRGLLRQVHVERLAGCGLHDRAELVVGDGADGVDGRAGVLEVPARARPTRRRCRR
jgi:hypothetical protein